MDMSPTRVWLMSSCWICAALPTTQLAHAQSTPEQPLVAKADATKLAVKPDWIVRTKVDALASARRILGVSDASPSSIELVTNEGDVLPCLAQRLRGEPVWKLRFDAMVFDLDRPDADRSVASQPKRSQPLNLEVTLLAKTGQLYQVASDLPRDPKNQPWPPARSAPAAERMKISGGEVWTDLPSNPPKHSLAEVLRLIEEQFGGGANARQILAYFVTQKTETSGGSREVWSVEYRGLPAFGESMGSWGGRPAKLDVNAVNHLRHVVLDRSGVWETATTTPQPDPPETQTCAQAPKPLENEAPSPASKK